VSLYHIKQNLDNPKECILVSVWYRMV